jgi:transcriptional regulator with XRE-family HTH domain
MKKKPTKLTTAQVKKIKKDLAADKLTQPQIAKKYNVSRSLISNIATGRAHKDVDGPVAPAKGARGQSKKAHEYDPADARVLELEAEIAHLRDERNHARRKLLAAAKTQGLFKAMTTEMEAKIKPFRALPKPRRPYKGPKKRIEEHLVMHISDGHHDQIVTPNECGGLEAYDFPVSICRAENYVDTVLKWTQETLAPTFKFPELTILAYGDHTSGEIHGHVNRSYFRNQFKNSAAIGQLHALMYRDLAPYFDNINVVYVPGNHGRRSIKKNYHGAHDNWDYLVATTADLYCRDLENVHFTIPDAFSINLDIAGIGFCIFHGDDVRSQLGIPWYGLERRQRRIMAMNKLQGGPPVRYYCCGHFHRAGCTTELDGELMMNGTWVGTDAYAYNAFSGFSEPTQMIHGVSPSRGVTWRLPVKLRTEHERTGPKRYKIDLMEEVGNG